MVSRCASQSAAYMRAPKTEGINNKSPITKGSFFYLFY